MAEVQTNIRTNNSEQFEAPHMKMWVFEAKKGQKFATNIAMEFHVHAFCAPDFILGN